MRVNPHWAMAIRSETKTPIKQHRNIGKPDLGEIHDGEGKGAGELPDGPAPGNPLTKISDEGKLPPHVHEQDEDQRRNLPCHIGDDDHQQAAGRDDADDLAELPDRGTPGLHRDYPPVASAGAV